MQGKDVGVGVGVPVPVGSTVGVRVALAEGVITGSGVGLAFSTLQDASMPTKPKTSSRQNLRT